MNKATIEWTVSQLPADEWMYKCTKQFARQLAIQLISDLKWITNVTCIFFVSGYSRRRLWDRYSEPDVCQVLPA